MLTIPTNKQIQVQISQVTYAADEASSLLRQDGVAGLQALTLALFFVPFLPPLYISIRSVLAGRSTAPLEARPAGPSSGRTQGEVLQNRDDMESGGVGQGDEKSADIEPAHYAVAADVKDRDRPHDAAGVQMVESVL